MPKYKTFELDIDGYKIIITDDPLHTKNKGVYKKGLWECYLVQEQYYGICLFSKKAFENDQAKKTIPRMLLKEIELAKRRHLDSLSNFQ